MKYKLLRYSLLSLLVMLCGGGIFAALAGVNEQSPEVSLDFTDKTKWNIPDEGSSNTQLATFTNGTYSIKLSATNNYKMNTGYLILGKKDSYLELPAFNFDVEKIEVVGTGSASESVKQNIYVGDVAVSTETTGAKNVTNTYLINSDYQAAGNIYKFVVTSAHNTQISKINVYKKSSGDTPAEVSYYVMGENMPGLSWDVLESNKMEAVPTAAGLYSKTYKNVLINASPNNPVIVYYKFKSSEGTWYPDPGDNLNYVIREGGYYDITITFNVNDFDNNNPYNAQSFTPTKTADLPPTIESLQALQESVTAQSQQAFLNFDNVIVTAVKGKNAYLADANNTYGALVYINNHGLEVGQVLNGTGLIDYTLYNFATELTSLDKSGLQITTGTVTPTEKTIAEVTQANQSTVVTLKGVTYNDTDKTFTDGTNTVKYYDSFSASPTLENGKKYDVTGVVVLFKQSNEMVIEICPRTAADVVAATESTEPVEWPEGVEGETWKINTTVAMPTQTSSIPVTGQDCKVAYLTDAAEAYLNISISGITVIAKGTVDADKNVTIPAGQIVGQYMNQPAAIFAQGATGGQEDVVFTYSETDEKISLTNASFCVALGQAATVTLSNTEIYKEKPAPAAADYYVVGNMTEWGVKADYQMTKNEQAETEEYMFTMDLTTQSQFKVVKSDGVSQTWYPDGMGNSYGENGEITKDGNYTIYFRPKADGGDDWFYGVIYAAANETPVEDNAIWSSDQAVYCENITVEASKFANVTVGDILHVIVEGTNAESEYNSHVRILNGNGKQLENGVNVGKQPDGTDVGFVLTGDILTQLKATGLKLGGYGYSSKLITVESTETTGSDASIWVGASTGNIDMSNFHFANFNDFAGVKKGDIIRVTLDASNWVSGTSGWVNLQYKSGDSGWDWKDTQDTDLVEITNHWNGDPVEILINSDELAAEMNDAAKNHGVVVQAGEATIITQVELIPAPVTVDNLWIVGDGDGWQISTEVNLPNLKAMTFNEETQAFEYEVSVLNSDGFYFAFGDVASSDSWDDFNENHRYAARNEEVEVVENQPIQLQKCAGTLKITTEGVYTLSVTKDLMLSIKKTGEIEPVTTDKLYIIGDMNHWDRTAMTEMTVNSAGNYEYELTTEADCYFAFATKQLTAEEAQADPNWEVFSANYRWTIAAGNTEAELDHEYELQKADGNVVLHAGQYTVIVTPDMKMIITGTPAEQPTEFEYSAVYVAGNGADKNWLNGKGWDAGAEENKLTEVSDDVWEITLENVAAGEGYEFKFTVDGGWNVNFGIEDPTAFAFGTEYPGVVNGANIKFSLTEASDVTMHLDMSAYDNTTKQGAKFTVTATAAGEEPVEDEGLWITWGEDDVATAGNLQARYGEEDFYLTYVDNNSKLSVDASNAFFGTADAQKKFTHRLKSGGASNSNNNMTLHIAKAGKLNVYARSGSPSATDRNLVLTQGDTELYNEVVKDADAIQVAEADLNVSAPALDEVVYKSVYPVITVEVAAGELTIGYPTGSMNFYAFQLIPDDGPITGIRNIEVTENPMFDESLPAYNLQGQRVTKSYRGVVIQNGRKFYNK
jgi:hypothetical protein